MVEVALEHPTLSPRELSVKITDEQRIFISESSVYRILKIKGLITTPAHILLAASNQFKEKIITKKLFNFKSSDKVLGPELNGIFKFFFNALQFTLSTTINIEKFINDFEDSEHGEKLEIDYDASDLTYCTLKIDGLDEKIVITDQYLTLVSHYNKSPQQLIASFRSIHSELASAQIKLLD